MSSTESTATTGSDDGGSLRPDEQTLIEILDPSSPPIDARRCTDFVRDPSAGAVATFEGTTRDTFDGRRVIELRYEAYVSMALRRLAAVCAAARASWPLRRIAVAHRLGVVPVGETSVHVAVSAEHRAPAIDACRFIIDELKATVPIWKKEVYEDGEVWKENKEFFDGSEAAASLAERSRKTAEHPCCGNKTRVESDANRRGKDETGKI